MATNDSFSGLTTNDTDTDLNTCSSERLQIVLSSCSQTPPLSSKEETETDVFLLSTRRQLVSPQPRCLAGTQNRARKIERPRSCAHVDAATLISDRMITDSTDTTLATHSSLRLSATTDSATFCIMQGVVAQTDPFAAPTLEPRTEPSGISKTPFQSVGDTKHCPSATAAAFIGAIPRSPLSSVTADEFRRVDGSKCQNCRVSRGSSLVDSRTVEHWSPTAAAAIGAEEDTIVFREVDWSRNNIASDATQISSQPATTAGTEEELWKFSQEGQDATTNSGPPSESPADCSLSFSANRSRSSKPQFIEFPLSPFENRRQDSEQLAAACWSDRPAVEKIAALNIQENEQPPQPLLGPFLALPCHQSPLTNSDELVAQPPPPSGFSIVRSNELQASVVSSSSSSKAVELPLKMPTLEQNQDVPVCSCLCANREVQQLRLARTPTKEPRRNAGHDKVREVSKKAASKAPSRTSGPQLGAGQQRYTTTQVPSRQLIVPREKWRSVDPPRTSYRRDITPMPTAREILKFLGKAAARNASQVAAPGGMAKPRKSRNSKVSVQDPLGNKSELGKPSELPEPLRSQRTDQKSKLRASKRSKLQTQAATRARSRSISKVPKSIPGVGDDASPDLQFSIAKDPQPSAKIEAPEAYKLTKAALNSQKQANPLTSSEMNIAICSTGICIQPKCPDCLSKHHLTVGKSNLDGSAIQPPQPDCLAVPLLNGTSNCSDLINLSQSSAAWMVTSTDLNSYANHLTPRTAANVPRDPGISLNRLDRTRSLMPELQGESVRRHLLLRAEVARERQKQQAQQLQQQQQHRLSNICPPATKHDDPGRFARTSNLVCKSVCRLQQQTQLGHRVLHQRQQHQSQQKPSKWWDA